MPLTEQSRQHLSAQLTRVLLTLLVGLAIGSAAVGADNALHRSQDFQWSGAHLLAHRLNPWAEYLKGDPSHSLIVTQIPNYLPILYVLLLPLGFLSVHPANLIWLACNLFFAASSGIIAARANALRGRAILLVVCLLFLATATRNTVGNGQQGLLVLFLWCLACRTQPGSTSKQAALYGLSYLKFSFAPPVFLYLLFRSGRRAAAYSLLPALLGVALVWLWLPAPHSSGSLLSLVREPFQVARTGFTPLSGDQDLMYAVQSLLQLTSGTPALEFELAAALAVCLPVAYLAFYVRRGRSTAWHMAILATMSYAFFKHHAYDGVVLILPLCYALKRWRTAGAKLVLILLSYLFYGQRLLEAAHLHPQWAHVPEFAMLLIVLATVYRMPDNAAASAVPLEFPHPAYDDVALAG